MSGKKKYVLETIRAQAEEAVGGTDVEFEFNGQTYSIPHPIFVDDEWRDGFVKAEGNTASAKYLLGDEQYERFVADKGDPLSLMLMWQQAQRDGQDALINDPGTPTPSSTS